MIYSVLWKSAGFYSLFFFTINHYLYSKSKKRSFKIISDDWLFKYEKGWEDYFLNIDIMNDNDENYNTMCLGHPLLNFDDSQTVNLFTTTEYKNAIKEIYLYNDITKQYIYETKKRLQLIDQQYDSIFIRRGDKLIIESQYIHTDEYIELLLKKNPNSERIFLQTDDYNCYLDLEKYIKTHKLNIKLITLCDEKTKGGMFMFSKDGIEWALKENANNKEYLNNQIENINNTTPICSLNNEEMYQHTITMITGIDIVLHSNICICDYSSNVSRFIKLAHINSDHVYNLLSPDTDINMNSTMCPAYGFELISSSL